MDERDVSIILKALADKIRMLEWDNEQLRARNEELHITLAKMQVND